MLAAQFLDLDFQQSLTYSPRMISLHAEALRISPRFTSIDWKKLNRNSKKDWNRAAAVVKDRLDGRFLRFATQCLRSRHSGFVVLSIDSLLLETIQQFREGVTDGQRQSKLMVTRFLEGERFQPDFNREARDSYYRDIRCGLLHQAEAKGMWLIRRGQQALLQPSPYGKGYIIDVQRFHKALCGTMEDYLFELCDPRSSELRDKLWTKMDHICNLREQRGAVYLF